MQGNDEKNCLNGTSLVTQGLRLYTFNAGGSGLIHSERTKIPHAMKNSQKLKKEKSCFVSSTKSINISTPTRSHFSEISEHHRQREGLACFQKERTVKGPGMKPVVDISTTRWKGKRKTRHRCNVLKENDLQFRVLCIPKLSIK